jgi:hypothetical protein
VADALYLSLQVKALEVTVADLKEQLAHVGQASEVLQLLEDLLEV